MSVAILVVLVLGIGAGFILPENISGFIDSASSYMLLILLFFLLEEKADDELLIALGLLLIL